MTEVAAIIYSFPLSESIVNVLIKICPFITGQAMNASWSLRKPCLVSTKLWKFQITQSRKIILALRLHKLSVNRREDSSIPTTGRLSLPARNQVTVRHRLHRPVVEPPLLEVLIMEGLEDPQEDDAFLMGDE
jgi:hypothetical protein